MKKIVLFMMSVSLICAKDVTITQNNPPHQNEVKRKHPVIFVGDLLWGRVDIPKATAVNLDFSGLPVWSKPGFPIVTENWLYFNNGDSSRLIENGSKLGFYAGIGVGVNSIFNLSLNWQYLHSSGHDKTNFTFAQNDTFSLLGFAYANVGADILNVAANDSFRNLLQLVEMLVQTSHWMTSKLIIQPFAGVRYLYQRARQTAQVLLPSPITEGSDFVANERFTWERMGIILGTDLKFLITRHFFFFATILSQLTYDIAKVTTKEIKIDNVLSSSLRFDSSSLDLVHSWGRKFGFAWENVFGDDWLLSLRIFMELQESIFAAYGFGFTVLF